MKRNAAGQFIQSWDSEAKRRISISLTNTAWRLLNEEAQRQKTSCSEVIEQCARNLTVEDNYNSEDSDTQIAFLQDQLLKQQEQITALQQQKQALELQLKSASAGIAQATQTKVSSILESITDAFVAFDRNWCYTYVNYAAAQILRKAPEELIGKNVWSEIFPDEVGGIAYQALHQAVAEQIPVSWEELGRHGRCLEVHGYPSAEGVAVYFRDVTERKQAEAEREQLLQELEIEKTRLATILQQMPAGVLIADAASERLILANEQAQKIIGYNYEEEEALELENYSPVIPFTAFRPNGQIYHNYEYPLVRSLKTGEVIHYEEMEIRQENGNPIFITVNASPIWNSERQILAAVAIFQDITERKNLESELKQQERQFQLLIENIPDVISRVDSEFRHLYVSPSINNTTGIAPEQFIGKTNLDLGMPEDLCHSWHTTLHQVFTTREEQTSEFSFPTLTGTRWYQSRLVPEFTEDGSVASVLGIARDVTDYKQAEQALRDSEERLMLALAAAQTISWDMDLRTNWVVCSPNALEFFGLQTGTAEEFLSLIHPDDRPKVIQATEQAMAGGMIYSQEYRILPPNGQLRWMNGKGQVYFNEMGQGIRMMGVSVDITERKQTEEALHQALQKLNSHVENTPMAVIEWDQDFRVTRWSAGAERILGWKAEEMLGQALTDIPFVFEEDLEAVTEVCQRLVYGPDAHISSSNRNYTKDGKLVHCEWYNSSLRDESGRMTSILSLVLDVTERKQSEQEREQLLERERIARAEAESAQSQLTTIFETSPVGLALLDSEQRFIAINGALAEINGFSPEQHLGVSIPELFRQSDPHLIDVFKRIYRTGEPFISPNFPVNVPGRSDRRPGYYNVYYLPTINLNHHVESVLIYVVDVTKRVRLEQAQQFLAEASAVLASSLDYQTTLERVAQLVVPELADWCTVHILEEDGTIEQIAVAHVDPAKLEWAHKMREKYPLNPEDARGAAFTLRTGQSDFVPEIPDDLLVAAARDPEHLEILRQVGFSSVMTVPLQTQSRVMGVISFISAESGRQYTAVDLRLAEDLARRASLAIENAQLYQVAQRDRAKAEAANRIKDEFLAVLSHELRSPLNPILGWTKLLRSERLNPTQAKQALETIERNARLQAQLIEDLLDVSRILQGKMSLNIAPVNLVSTIEAALETVRLAAEAKHIQIQTGLHPLSGTILGDANRLQQVVWNLLTNAVKFTPARGQVKIKLEQVGNYAQIQVQDTGKGINPDFLPHIFDYFRQEDSSVTRKFGGLGLGLALVRQLTELHGGTVQAESLGQNLGASFTVRLPLNVIRETQITKMEPLEFAADLDHIRVLVVDDDPDMRELASFILTQAGAQVTTAASAIQALSSINQSVPDLLLCDIGMPGMDGYSLIQQVRKWIPEQGGTIPAIALTAYAGELNQQQALAAGFQMHISKPVDPERLVQEIVLLLRSSYKSGLNFWDEPNPSPAPDA